MAALALVRTPGGWQPHTEADRELSQRYKVGEVAHGDFKKMRNARFHGKFFSMLDLAWQYWEPTGGLVPRQELRGIHGLAKFFEELSGKPGQLSDGVAAYIARLEADRAVRFPAVDKSREAFREEVIVDSGHFDLVQTPAGVKKVAKSISFANMEQHEFDPLYHDVFNTCWRLVLSSHFDTEADAMSAADLMGSYA